MILCMYHDVIEDWIRLEVLKYNDDKDEMLIKLIDFGTEELLSLIEEDKTKFRCLPAETVNIPCQAVTLMLPIAPVDDDDGNTEDRDETLMTLIVECILNSEQNDGIYNIRYEFNDKDS